MKCVVVTPEKTILDVEANFVVVPLFDGEYGVAPRHTPLIGRIGGGELRITNTANEVESWYIEGGFVEILNDVVSILTQKACKSNTLNSVSVRQELEELLHPGKSGKEVLNRDLAINNARSKVRLAEKRRK